jgi:hypothetical protein
MSVAAIKIGYSLSLTGALAANGQTALLARKVCEEHVNLGKKSTQSDVKDYERKERRS